MLLIAFAQPTSAEERAVPEQGPPPSALGDELRRFLHDEATATLHSRSYFLDRQNQSPPNNAALVTGGWVGLQSGWLYDTFQIGAVGYTTQPVWAPQNRWDTSDGTLLLKPGGYGFFTLGQAYASARWSGQAFTGFRQYVDELEVNPHDDRELPQTFEAYALRGALGPVNYFAGYVAAMKPRDYSDFINMGEAGGAPNVNAGMALGSVKYGSMDNFQLRASTYYVPDILWSSYGDAGGTIKIDEHFTLRLAGQFAAQGSNGLNLLTGQPFSTFWGGGRADALWGPMFLWLAYTQVGSAAAWRAPYGIFIGYNKMQVLDFNRAGERALTIGGGYDFKGAGLPGVMFLASATYGGNAVDTGTGRALSDNWEYDLDLRFQAEPLPLPDFLKPLQLRGRVAFVNQYLNNTLSNAQTEYRVVLNYEVSWKGPRRR
ncbi:MAG: OprD family porin [Reyranella sp.]|nr:OprD family porin [Reyranella sp.]